MGGERCCRSAFSVMRCQFSAFSACNAAKYTNHGKTASQSLSVIISRTLLSTMRGAQNAGTFHPHGVDISSRSEGRKTKNELCDLWPKSIPPKKRAIPGANWRCSVPDWDNLGKLVSDSLNGVVWTDDARVVSGHVWKRYGDRSETRVRVRMLT